MTARALTIEERNRLRASIGIQPIETPAPKPPEAAPEPAPLNVMKHVYAERPATCGECGAPFTQVQLSPSWVAMATRHDPKFPEKFPDGWTPPMCPRCTRILQRAEAEFEHYRELRRQADANVASRKQHVIHELEKPRQELLDV